MLGHHLTLERNESRENGGRDTIFLRGHDCQTHQEVGQLQDFDFRNVSRKREKQGFSTKGIGKRWLNRSLPSASAPQVLSC
jgi:hypothetical protein